MQSMTQQSIQPALFVEVVTPLLGGADAQVLADAVTGRWTPAQVCELLKCSHEDARRAAAVVLGLVGTKAQVGCLAKALHDHDQQLAGFAEHAMWSIWFRSGEAAAMNDFHRGVCLLNEERYELAIDRFDQAIWADPQFAEAHNQRAICLWLLERWDASIDACRRAVKLAPAHFGAIAGMGHSYAELGQLDRAVACYRNALAVNPRMDAIRAAIQRVESSSRSSDGVALTAQRGVGS